MRPSSFLPLPLLFNKQSDAKREGIGEIRSAVCLALAGSASTTYLLKEAAATAIFKIFLINQKRESRALNQKQRDEKVAAYSVTVIIIIY